VYILFVSIIVCLYVWFSCFRSLLFPL